MKQMVLASLLSVCLVAPQLSQAATKEEMMAFVKKAVKYIKAHGKDEAFKTFSDHRDTEFHQGELYMFVYDYKGKCLAHGIRPTLIGANALDLKDPDGFALIAEMVKIAQDKKSGTIKYKWSNPLHNKVENKLSYFEDVDGEYFVGSGIYSD